LLAAHEGPALAALKPSVKPSLGLRITRSAPGAFLIELGIDLIALLEPMGGAASPPGADLALFRFPATLHGIASFQQQLLSEFAGFPTDPSRVSAGSRAG